MAIIKRKIENLKPGKEYIVTARAKNADVNVLSDYTDTIRFRVPTDTTIPEAVFNLRLYQSVENVMFVFDNVSDKDILTYEYELYSDVSGTILVSTGFNDASVFTVAVDNLQTDAEGQGLVPYWGRVRAIDTSNNVGEWTLLAKTDERVPLIDNQFIGSLTASKITAGSIGAHEIILTQPGPQTIIEKPALSAILRSSNYNGSYNSATETWNAGTEGWVITGDGRAEFNDAIIRGRLSSVELHVGTGANSFHIDKYGNIWSGSDEFSFNTAPFSVTNTGVVKIRSGSIDIGSGNTSFHVGADGRLWMGSESFDTAKFSIEPYGYVKVNNGIEVGAVEGLAFPSTFYGVVRMAFGMRVEGATTSKIQNGISIHSITQNADAELPLIALNAGGLFSEYSTSQFGSPSGHSQFVIRRTKDVEKPVPVDPYNPVTFIDRQSHFDRQMIKIVNESAPLGSPGTNTVAGIGFGVGRYNESNVGIYGCVLRCFPGTGGSPITPLENREWISGLVDDPNRPGLLVESYLEGESGFDAFTGSYYTGPYNGMTGAGWNGLDVGSYMGDGFGYIGAASFVIRSSKEIKENIEYMPSESRSISVERIRSLKPARWDDKAKLSYGAPSKKFQEINKKWVSKGKRPLVADWKHYDSFIHDCITDDCIGNEFKDCPEVEFYKKRYGFIAEDVAEVFPKAVQFSTIGHPIGIDYAVVTYSLVETAQHLLDKIDELESKISELSSENSN